MKTIRMALVPRGTGKMVAINTVCAHKPELNDVFWFDVVDGEGEGETVARLRLHPVDARLLHDHLGALLRSADKVVEHAFRDADPRLTR